MPSKKFLIADPSLTDLRGHHYSLTRAAADSARHAGFDVKWFVSQSFSNELASAHPEAIPAFGSGMYDAYKPPAGDMPRRGLFNRFFRPKPAEPPAPNLAQSMLDGIRAGLEATGAGQEDHLFFHTCDGATYKAVAQLFYEQRQAALPIIHLCTPYDPVGVMPNRKSAEEVAAPIHDMEETGLIGSRVHLYAENEYLAAHLSELWEVDVSPLPLPVDGRHEADPAAVSHFRKDVLGVSDDTFVVSSLGAARLEKGFNLFPDIIRRTFELAEDDRFPGIDSTRIHFALHASPQIIGRHPVITSTLEKLETFDSNKVSLFTEQLVDSDYQIHLTASDIVCLPYGSKDYRVRSSGIVTEAVAAQKFLVATEGTYPGEMAKKFSGGTGNTPYELATAILKLIHEIKVRRNYSQASFARYRDENRLQNYIGKLKGLPPTK